MLQPPGSVNRRADAGRCIFDVDGVLIDTPHERAWQEALKVLMQGEWQDLAPTTTYAPERFTTAVYQEYVAGKPRLDGASGPARVFRRPERRRSWRSCTASASSG